MDRCASSAHNITCAHDRHVQGAVRRGDARRRGGADPAWSEARRFPKCPLPHPGNYSGSLAASVVVGDQLSRPSPDEPRPLQDGAASAGNAKLTRSRSPEAEANAKLKRSQSPEAKAKLELPEAEAGRGPKLRRSWSERLSVPSRS
eukprot:gene12884-biopygen8185